jgi:PilZ domain-containing protein
MQVYQHKNPRRATDRAGGTGQERRLRTRYPLRMALTYKILRKGRKCFLGQTIDISSNGLLFTTEEPIPVRTGLEILIDWPVMSPDRGPLKLELFARTVRINGNQVAAEILSHHLLAFVTGEEIPSGEQQQAVAK